MGARTAWLEAQRAGLLGLERLASGLGRGSQQPKHLQVGLRGEFEALFHLRREGYQVVERRWRSPELNSDVDLIAWEGDRLCFVEVKTRTARDRTPAEAAIDDAKKRLLRQMARAYLRTLPRTQAEGLLPRFDRVSVYLEDDRVTCELLRDAFSLTDYGRDVFRRRGV